MDQHRPRTVVELGAHNGFSYFNFCEAAVRLGLDTRLYAIDSWKGDDHAGFYDESVYELVSATNERYADRSTLLRGYFSERAADIRDDSVDLLHIDGRHAYEDVREDYETYFPKLSTRAIVVFHDVAEHKEGFGVYRFWDEVSRQYPSFTFEHSSGLGVLFVGEESRAPFETFLRAAKKYGPDIRDDYHGLGSAIEERFATQERANDAAVARLELEHIRSSKSYRYTNFARAIRGRLPR